MKNYSSLHLSKVLWKIFVYVVLGVGGIAMLIPLVWTVSTAFKDYAYVFTFPPQWIPDPIVWNLPELINVDALFPVYYRNSVLITSLCIFGLVMSCSLSAFGFARLRAPGRDFLFLLILSTIMLPIYVTLIPLYVLFNKLGWLDTFYPLIIPSFFGHPFLIFLLRQFYMSIPTELDNAARIDGCSTFGIYWRIILPLSKPALAAVVIFSMMWRWNDFINPLIFLNTQSKFTLPVGLMFLSTGETFPCLWNLLMLAALLAVLPCLVLFFFAQKLFIQGITITGLKE